METYEIGSKEELYTSATVPKLVKALNDGDVRAKIYAVQALSRISPTPVEVAPALASVMRADHSDLRFRTAILLSEMGTDARVANEALTQALVDEKPLTRLWAAIALLVSGDPNPVAKGLIAGAMIDENANLRLAAVKGLGKIGVIDEQFIQVLQGMAINDENPNVKKAAALTLLNTRAKPSSPVAHAEVKTDYPRVDLPALVDRLPRTVYVNRDAVAVIVGNRQYQGRDGVPNVDFAHNDAESMYRYVTQTLGYRDGNVIFIKDATQADLVRTFGNRDNPHGKLYDWVRAGQSDVFVYYSGHGAPGLSSGKGYLLPVDADPMRVELNGYSLDTLYSNLDKLPARSVTVLLDACFSGSSSSGSIVKNASSIVLKPVITGASIRNGSVVTASAASEVASWDQVHRLGLLTRHFLEGVSGKADQGLFGDSDGRVTLAELKAYLESEVTYWARREYGREQHPQVAGNEHLVLSELNLNP